MNQTSKSSYAPLDVCLLVDYRLSSRSLIREQVTTTNIFDQVCEEGAISVGLNLVRARKVEACIFGPSVKPEKIQEFILATRCSKDSAQCAFLAFQPKDRQEAIPGAHSVLNFPASQRYFNISLVQALAGAHGGTIPALKRRNPHNGEWVSLKERLALLDFPGKEPQIDQSYDLQNEPWPSEVPQEAVKNFPTLCDRLLEVEPYYLKFKIDGTPSDFTRNAIGEVIEEVFPHAEASPAMRDFKHILEEHLYSWIKSATLHGRLVATAVLRRAIIGSFRELPEAIQQTDEAGEG
jgi:hypothetical protein